MEHQTVRSIIFSFKCNYPHLVEPKLHYYIRLQLQLNYYLKVAVLDDIQEYIFTIRSTGGRTVALAKIFDSHQKILGLIPKVCSL